MNLVICHTPLQVLIAKKIIEENGNQDFHFFMFSYVDNEKFRYYYQFLAKKAAYAHFERLEPEQPLLYFKRLYKIKKLYIQEYYNIVYLASINSFIIHFLLSHIQFNALETFDDGTANILANSIYRSPPLLPIKQRIIRKLLNINYDIFSVMKNSRLHHTIYKNRNNIINNLHYLPLIQIQKPIKKITKTIRILLGQPLLLTAEENVILATKLIKKFNIDLYFPHPREQYVVPNVNYIHSPLIFEDWLTQSLMLDTAQFEIYHLFSTAALNIADCPSVQSIAIEIINVHDINKDVRNVFIEFGIEIKRIEMD